MGIRAREPYCILLVDGKGACLGITSTGANGNERQELLTLVDRIKNYEETGV